MYQEVWSATFCQLPSQQKRQRRRASSFGVGLKWMHISCVKLGVTFTFTKYSEKSPSHDRGFPFTARNELIETAVQSTPNCSAEYTQLQCRVHPTAGVSRDLGPVDRLVGLVVRRPPRERKIPGSNPACDGIFSGSSHTSDLKIGTPVATLPGAWRYRVSIGTGRPGVGIL